MKGGTYDTFVCELLVYLFYT